MLSIKKLSSSSEAGKYYQKADYYTKGEGQTDIESGWHGQGAEDLGLSGAVDKDSFVKILDGNLPNGQSLARQTGDRVPGWDLTFSAPKSVSLMGLVGDDKRILQAHLEAVKTTLSFLEKEYLVTRVTKNGESSFENTEAMVAALFTHTTSRSLDPQLHTHSVVTNATMDETGKYKTLESSPIFKNKMLLGQVYRSELANAVKQLGYEIEWDKQKGTFEIVGIPKEHIDAYSKRRKHIEGYAKENELEGGKDMDRAALATRDSKKDVATRDVIKQWDKEAEELGFDHQSIKEAAIAKSVLSSENEHGADEVVRFAYNNLAYNEAVFTRQDLLKESLLFAHGEKTVSSIDKTIDRFVNAKELILAKQDSDYGKDTVSYTTESAIDIEKHNLRLLSRGIDEVGELGSKQQYQDFESRFNEKEKYPLMKEQSETVRQMVFSKDRFTALQGFAGTGKSFSLKAFREFAEERGFNVTGYAPTGQASQNLMQSAGIESNTIDSLLERLNKGKELPDLTGDIWVVDEAGMANARQMNELLNFSIKTNARIRFVGDKKQLPGVEWGRPFEQAQNDALDTFTMSNIVRQNKDKVPHLYNAVRHSIDGDPQKAFSSLKLSSSDDTGVKQISAKKGIEASAMHYVDLIGKSIDSGSSVDEAITRDTKLLILTNEDRRTANEIVRTGLQEKNIIGADKLETQAYINKQMKPEEKADAHNYEKGLVVRFLSDNEKLNVKENSYYTVTAVDKKSGTVSLKNKSGHTVSWNPNLDGAREEYNATVYESIKTSLAEGDFIRWRDKNEQAGLKNADVGKVNKIEGSVVTMSLKSGESVTFNTSDERYKHFEHEYAATLYSAQGDTYRNVVGYLNDKNKYLLTQKALYVAISRAENNAMFYVTNEEKVSKVIEERAGNKTSALEGIGYQYDGTKEAKSSLFNTVPILRNLDEVVLNAASELVSYDSVFSRNALIKSVYKNTRTSYTVENINQSIDRLAKENKLKHAYIEGKNRSIGAFTTNEAIVKEWRIATYVERGFNKHDQLGAANQPLSDVPSNTDKSSLEALKLTLTNKDRFISIDSNDRQASLNYLRSANEIAEQRGHNIRGLSSSRLSAEEITNSTGMPAQTIASFLHRMERIDTLPEYKNEVWVVDQSQMVSKSDIEKLVSLADKTNARVIFSSQNNAIESIQSGGAVKQLVEAGMKSAKIVDTKSQNAVIENHIKGATEEKDKDERLKIVAKSIVSNIDKNGFFAFVPSKQDRNDISAIVRGQMKSEGLLHQTDTQLNVLEDSGLNPHQQAIALNYKKGMFIQLNSNDSKLGLKKGEYYSVKKAGLGSVTLISNGNEVSLSDARLKEHVAIGLKVFKENTIKLSAGDLIRSRVNYKGINVNNGEQLKVKEVSKEGVTAINGQGKTITLDQKDMKARHFEYAYSSGVHNALGKKVESAVLLLESYRKNLVSKRSINTVLSSVNGVTEIVTDNKSKLNLAVDKYESEKQNALKGTGILDKLNGQEDFTDVNKTDSSVNVGETIKNAVSHLYEKESVFSRSALVQTAIQMSNAPLKDVNNHIDKLLKSGQLVQAKIELDGKSHSAMITTKGAIKRERYIQDLFKSGKGSYKPVATAKDALKESEKLGLNERQETVLENVTTSRDQFLGLEGRHTKELYQSLVSLFNVGQRKSMNMRFFSPRTQLAEQINERTGIETKSIQGHILGLSNSGHLRARPKDVWVVTDSHMLSTHEVADTMTLARRTGAKVVFHHDEKAAAAMGQGQNLKVLEDAGFKSHSINSPDTRKMRLLGKTYNDEESLVSSKGVKKFESIIEVEDKEAREQRMVNDYLSVDDKAKSNYMLVVATEKDRTNVTAKIRSALKLQGKISEKESEAVTYSRVPMSIAQRLSTDNYEKGYVVKFERGVKGGDIKPGEYLEIVDVKNTHMVIKTSTGKMFNWEPHKVAAASSRGVHIFRKDKIRVAEGDKVRFTETNKKQELQKGNIVSIVKIEKNIVTVRDNKNRVRELDLSNPEHRHISHSYVETYVSAQSAKSKPIVLGQVESFQRRLLSQRNLYSVMNKAQSKFIGYVDNKSEVDRQIKSKSGTKLNAIDVDKKNKTNSLFKSRNIDQTKTKPLQKQKEKTFTFGKGFGGPSL